MASFVCAQVPEDVSVKEHQIIQQEHKTTRKFFSDEFTRQRNELFAEFDDRAQYYEQKFDSTISSAVWKLSCMWAAITFFIIGLTSMLRVKLERRRLDKLTQTVIESVSHKLGAPRVTEPVLPKNFVVQGMAMPAPRKSWSERRRDEKARKQAFVLQKKLAKQKQEYQKELMKLEQLKRGLA